jgi:hypothetical protein
VSRDVSPPSVINLNDFIKEDTLDFWFPQWLTFDFVSSNQKVFGVEVYLDEKKLTFQGSTGSFEINPSDYPGRDYVPLRLVVYTESGTGSLADKIHAEGYYFDKTWILAVNRVEPYLPNIRYTINEERFLKLEWDRYPGDYFSSYVLEIEYPSTNVFSYPIVGIFNQDQNYYIDPGYLGGPIKYTFYYFLEGPSRTYRGSSTTFEVNIPTPEISFSSTNDSLTIKWTRSKLNCIYKLNEPYYLSNEHLFSSEKDTSFTMPFLGLGPDKIFYLTLYGRKFVSGMLLPYITVSKTWSTGQNSLNPFDLMVYHPGSDLYYVASGYFFSILSPPDLKTPLKNIQLKDYCRNIDFIDDKGQVAILSSEISFYDTKTMELVNEYPVGYYTDNGLLEIVNDSIALFISNNNLITYDYLHRRPLYAEPFTTSYFSTKNGTTVSDNYNWFIYASDNGLCILENDGNNKFVKRFELNDRFQGAVFDPTHDNLIWVSSESKLMLFDLNTMGFINEFPEAKGYLLNLDLPTKRILLQSSVDKKIQLFNIENHKVEFSIPVINAWLPGFYYVNNTIYDNAGYQYDLSKYFK